MTMAVAFLRGINVGGRARVPMADLRVLAATVGLDDVRTYLQSGNLLFAMPSGGTEHLMGDLERAISERFGLTVRVLMRTIADLSAIVAANPMPGATANGSKLHVVFLAGTPSAEAVAALDADRSPPDVFAVLGGEIYVHYPEGSGRSKLTLEYFERRLGVAGTARNWNTVTKLVALAGP